jgi:predicted Zn-dependent protease
MFADFQIGVDLARGDLPAVEVGISNLARMPDDDGKSDVRRAQLFMRKLQFRAAKELLTKLLTEEPKGRFHIRSLRSIAASRDHDFDLAQRDIDFVKGVPGRENAVTELEVILLMEKGNLDEAEKLLNKISRKSAEAQTLYARIYELKADLPETPFSERQKLRDRAAEIRAQYRFVLEYSDYDD